MAAKFSLEFHSLEPKLPLGGEGAHLLAAGDFDSVQILDLTNCGITDVGASQLVWKTKDVPILYLDRAN